MYKIKFQFTSPVSFIERPVFDSILAYCHIKEKFGFVEQKLHLTDDELKALDDLPLKKHESGYYIASSMFFDKRIESTQFWCKRWNNEDDRLSNFGRQKKAVDTQRGQFKSYQMPIVLNDVGEGYFYFDSENKDRVQYLILKHLAGIGKKVSQGYGAFSKFTIEKVDVSDFFEKVYRPIPLEALTDSQKKLGGEVVYTGWRPPYWLSTNMRACFTV